MIVSPISSGVLRSAVVPTVTSLVLAVIMPAELTVSTGSALPSRNVVEFQMMLRAWSFAVLPHDPAHELWLTMKPPWACASALHPYVLVGIDEQLRGGVQRGAGLAVDQ